MPLFSRADGFLVQDPAVDRRMMPHLCWGRNASAVHHRMLVDVTETHRWLRQQNQTRPGIRPGVLHLFLWACAVALRSHPELNRFVSGGRLYQRRRIVLALSVRLPRGHPVTLTTVKLDATEPEAFPAFAARMQRSIERARAEGGAVDRQLELAARLPHPLLRATMAGHRLLDRLNLLPASAQADDPSFASLFVSDVGSLGLDDSFHHLFEIGNNSVFACFGRVRRRQDDTARERRLLTVNWTFDERIAEGACCARALKTLRRLMQKPDRLREVTLSTARTMHRHNGS